MEKDFIKVCEYVKQRTPWADDTPDEVVWNQAVVAFSEMKAGWDKSNSIIRICGQTGSGKTSQALWAVEEALKAEKKKPIVLGVRLFAKYHPKYEEFLSGFGQGEIREKTNGFALKCLCGALKLFIENGYSIVLDLTLLAPEFEEFVLGLLTKNGYQVTYHIMAVNDEISKRFLEKRHKDSGRVVYASSVDYFNVILEKGLEYLTTNDKNNLCYVWTSQDKTSVFHGKICECEASFKKNRNRTDLPVIDEQTLRECKLQEILDKK